MKLRILALVIFIAQPALAQSVLHYDETTGFNHGTRSQSLAMFTAIGVADGFSVTQDSDGSSFTQAILQNIDLVIFSNTSGDGGLNQSQRDALEWFVDTKGGSLMGIHAATDTYRHSTANGGSTGTWDWYAETMGGSVQQGPNHTPANHVDTINQINAHPSLDNMILPWVKEEEYYYWENGFLNADINEVLRVENTDGGDSWDAARPVAWTRIAASGARIFYTSLGHKTGNFTGDFPQFETLMESSVSWLLNGDQLPVELVQFDARADYEFEQVNLNWSTASETNSAHFELEHSADRSQWLSIDRLAAQGSSIEEHQYQSRHAEPLSGKNFYRLKQIDLDGQVNYSQLLEVDYLQGQELSAYPNPWLEKLTISFGSFLESARLQVFDVTGRVVLESDVSQSHEARLQTDSLAPGIYLVQLTGVSGRLVKATTVMKSQRSDF